MNEKKYSITKAYRWKPKEYLSNTFYKRGKTFFSSEPRMHEPVDLFRHTDAFVKSKKIKEFTLKENPIRDLQQKIKKRKKLKDSKQQIIRIERSPYLSNSSQIQKMMRLLVPVKGPNQSLKLQIRRHNELNMKNAQLMIVKRSQNFYDRMKAYSNRMGLPQDTKIYMMNSRDKHIKQALSRRGWIESSQKGSVLYHLKWVYKDNLNDYHLLQQGQFYNHFRNNQELTNKNYLRKNIKRARLQDRPNFPLSFDIELNDDYTNFQQTFIKFQAFKLLNKIGKYLSKRFSNLYNKILINPLFFSNQNSKQNSLPTNQKYLNLLYTTPYQELKQSKPTWQTLSIFFQFVCFLAETISKQKNIVYSIFRPKKDGKEVIKNIRKIEEELIFSEQFLFKHMSNFYVTELLKMWQHSKEINSNYGVQNMWILKPTGVSRGSGITITNDLAKIVQLRYGKIVQKYIEHPLLLDCKRKFDIRQWVLVTSFFPLKAYTFKYCYGRFSSLKYSNDKYQNMQKHLTNYSQNKESYLRQKLSLKDSITRSNLNTSSAMAEDQLHHQIGQKWLKIKQQFYGDILKTLNTCKSDIIHKQGCFQVYGFDIIIDQNYRPYILEVNMSPACQQRQFLFNYLQEMAEGLVDMIEGGEPKGWIELREQNYHKDGKLTEKERKITVIQRWWRKLAKVVKQREIIN